MAFRMSESECLLASLGAYGVKKFADTAAHTGMAVAVRANGGDVTCHLIDDTGTTWSSHVLKDGETLPGCWTSVQRVSGGTALIVFTAPNAPAWT